MVEKSVKKDTRYWVETLAAEAECTISDHKEIGQLLLNTFEQFDPWKEHFETLLRMSMVEYNEDNVPEH